MIHDPGPQHPFLCRAFVAGALLCAATAAAQEDATVPVEAEPMHETVLLNDHVQAFRVRVAPGASTMMHVHTLPDVAVRLATATIASESPGQPRGAPETASPGMVTARENAPAPTTHRVHNVGTTLFEVIDVQALQPPAAQPTAPIFEPVAENSRLRAYRYELAPGASTPQHTHARPCLLVAVTAGELQWLEAPATHTLTNTAAEPAVLVEIELK